MGEVGQVEGRPIFRDIRRYFCEYCGICRSKKALITAHINTHHKEVEKGKQINGEFEVDNRKSKTCKECGASFEKPAYLMQHMQSHSLERPYVCPVEDCQASYRRKDHLTRHSLQHQGKTFKCPIENCNSDFAFQGNITRHVNEFHSENSTSTTAAENPRQCVCPEVGCGKVFKFASMLKKHEDSHVKPESVDVVCLYPDCMKHFSNEHCLKEHIKFCHQYVTCETCGKKQLKKNIKRHLRTHETDISSESFECEYEDCDCTFSSKSNLQKHVKVVHFEQKPFACGFPGCGMRFSYKHVRDNHEKTGSHVYCPISSFTHSFNSFEEFWIIPSVLCTVFLIENLWMPC